MYKIGEILEVEIKKIAFGGEGLGHLDGMVIFVPMSCIGDTVKVKVISVKKTYIRALITEIIQASKDRIISNKISFKEHSGCDFAMLKYEKQLEYKTMMLKELFKFDITNIYDGIIGADNDKNYRNKVAEPFFIENGKINTGFYDRKSHDIFSAKEDILKSEISIRITEKVLEKLNEEKFSVYSDKNSKGFLKHLIIRNNTKNEVMLAIVVNGKKEINKLNKILEKLYNENSEIVSVYVSVKNKKNNVILGDENIHLFGSKILNEEVFGINFEIYLDSFFQINIEQVKKLYTKAISYIDDSDKMAIDAFSGTGTIAMLIGNKLKKVYAIESVKSAVQAAKNTAKNNGINNIKFICSKVEDKIENIVKYENIEYIVFDPPRKGIEQSVLNQVAKNEIKKIIYISCEPSTFARDFEILKEKGYKLTKLTAVDMFPNTHHIEIVALITK
ncbi:23S rRNA (uracil(1939)-C(5))-methyltransferase RlmD [Oceanivirga salmonicida]|uniref:23S rRNA (uracil(1939)-C(5))-methyltransferase RlmD n=1 Tax=Oceanivirga salmonicida TaxID=1769291 RepID=UPI0012E1ADC7|nr:23S rRNA (uracil(1939)-C(5))-methyltransferase RlmD [Oceanivirga salmonicida]